MKITDIEVIPVSIPTTPQMTSLGTFNTWEYAVVIVKTDEGVDGLGEISMIWDGASKVQCAFVEGYFKPLLIGEDPTAINLCLRKMDTLIEAAWPARAAIDMALFDIVGKMANLPVYQLLGGKWRDSIVLSTSVFIEDPNEMAKKAAGFVESGFKCVKVKVGLDPDHDVRAVAAVRKAIGDKTLLRIDANMGWRTAKDAIRNIKKLEPYNIHSVEQPIGRADIEDLRLIRNSVDTPIMVDESLWGPKEAFDLLRAGAVDMFNIYVAESGGLTNASLICRMAETVGVPCVHGGMPELGIGTAAAVHFAVSMTNLKDPCETLGAVYQQADVVNERFKITNGEIKPIPGPGLGVTLDRAALARYGARVPA